MGGALAVLYGICVETGSTGSSSVGLCEVRACNEQRTVVI